MHDIVDFVNVCSILLEIVGFILLLPVVIEELPKLFPRHTQGSHRAVSEIKQSAYSIGISLVIVGLIGQLLATVFHY